MKTLARYFVKITGFIPYLIILKPRKYFASYKAKKEKKLSKEGAIIISNHTSIFDYYLFIYHHFFHIVHTMVSYLVYRLKGLTLLNKIMGNIKINSASDNVLAINKAKDLLNKHKYVLIFPEGRLEDKKGELLPFKSSAISLAFTTNAPIIPYYIDGNYHLFKRVRYIKGEKIYIKQLINKDHLDEDDINYLNKYLMDKVNELKRILTLKRKHAVSAHFSKKLFMAYIVKVTSLPWYLICPTKVKYVDKKGVKRALKDNAIIASNHTGFFDPSAMSSIFYQRNIRIIALEDVWKHKFLAFTLNHGGIIKYRRGSMNGFDIKCFIEAKEILEAKGVLGIFPQGHLKDLDDFNEPLFTGLATLSLINKTPIIPMMFLNKYRIFRFNKVIVGKVIYPPTINNIDQQTINEYNHQIYEIMYKLLKEYKHD